MATQEGKPWGAVSVAARTTVKRPSDRNLSNSDQVFTPISLGAA
ncbi:MAG: hypothetical protein JWO25_2485 [Alphaproteobacteria bacterium]|nr:hypothetical protein [Alphaproteobacteria bacterium]